MNKKSSTSSNRRPPQQSQQRKSNIDITKAPATPIDVPAVDAQEDTINPETPTTEDIVIDTVVLTATTDMEEHSTDTTEVDEVSSPVVNASATLGGVLFANGYTQVVGFPATTTCCQFVNQFNKSFSMVNPRQIRYVSAGFIDNGVVITGSNPQDMIAQYNVNTSMNRELGSIGRVWYSAACNSVSDLINTLELADACITHRVKVLKINITIPAIRSALCDIYTKYNKFHMLKIVENGRNSNDQVHIVMFNDTNKLPAFIFDVIDTINPAYDISVEQFWQFFSPVVTDAVNLFKTVDGETK